ncbi:uncharacterized protein TNCV_1409091 [Trichonephila clavipes]|uniref:BTB domain-containing protein n=1 Tax=Trichonephila clavipes TaxID=2585209 RepID=A0A8X6RBR3_TRICX|nr:uncharacterized protein TNCV_1409091 [Trichonephila clavipes]
MAESSKTFLQVEDTKYIKIENFSLVNQCQKARDYFILRRNPFFQLFGITIYPNGISPETQGYVSIQLYKILRDPDENEDLKVFSGENKGSISWTLSVIDVNGAGKLYQSYAKENIANFPYDVVVPNFLERSAILKQSDELLPEDVLTVKCELYWILYSSTFLKRNISKKIWIFKEVKQVAQEIENERIDLKSYKKYVRYNERKHVKSELNRLIPSILDTVMNILVHRISNSHPTSFENFHDYLKKSDISDEIRRTYLSSYPIFQLYDRLKEIFRIALGDKRTLNERCQAKDLFYFQKLSCIPIDERKLQLMRMLDLKLVENDEETSQAFSLVCLSWSVKADTTIKEERLVAVNEFELEEENRKFDTGKAMGQSTRTKGENQSNNNGVNKRKFTISSKNEKKVQSVSKDKTIAKGQILVKVNDKSSTVNKKIISKDQLSVIDSKNYQEQNSKDYIEKAVNVNEIFMKKYEKGNNSEKRSGNEHQEPSTESQDVKNCRCVKSIGENQTLMKIYKGDIKKNEYKMTSSRNKGLEVHNKEKQKIINEEEIAMQEGKEIYGNEIEELTSKREDYLFGMNENEIHKNYVQKAIEYLLSNKMEPKINEKPNNEDKNNWMFFIQTMDDVVFALAFEKGKETLGSKLVSNSPVFESMLRNPMLEKFQKRVSLVDVESWTFINFLHFLQNGSIKAKSLSSLCSLYEMADKYAVEELMKICIDMMRPSFSLENISDIEKLGILHSDSYLLEMVKSFKAQNIDISIPALDDNEQISDEKKIY